MSASGSTPTPADSSALNRFGGREATVKLLRERRKPDAERRQPRPQLENVQAPNAELALADVALRASDAGCQVGLRHAQSLTLITEHGQQDVLLLGMKCLLHGLRASHDAGDYELCEYRLMVTLHAPPHAQLLCNDLDAYIQGACSPFRFGDWLRSLSDERLSELGDVAARCFEGGHSTSTDTAVALLVMATLAEAESQQVLLDPADVPRRLDRLLAAVSVEDLRRRGLLVVEEPMSIDPLVHLHIRLTKTAMPSPDGG